MVVYLPIEQNIILLRIPKLERYFYLNFYFQSCLFRSNFWVKVYHHLKAMTKFKLDQELPFYLKIQSFEIFCHVSLTNRNNKLNRNIFTLSHHRFRTITIIIHIDLYINENKKLQIPYSEKFYLINTTNKHSKVDTV